MKPHLIALSLSLFVLRVTDQLQTRGFFFVCFSGDEEEGLSPYARTELKHMSLK